MKRILCSMIAVGATALAGGEAAAQLERGLILSTPEAAVSQPVERLSEPSIRVSLSERTLHLMDGDRVVRSWPVSVGKPDYPTPTGTYSISRIIWNPSWVPPNSPWTRGMTAASPGDPANPMGRVKIFFREPTYYIHGSAIPSSLGEARSHGCVRMRNVDAMELGRILMENGGAERPDSWYQEMVERKHTSRTVRLSNPIRVRIQA